MHILNQIKVKPRLGAFYAIMTVNGNIKPHRLNR